VAVDGKRENGKWKNGGDPSVFPFAIFHLPFAITCETLHRRQPE
jgi:hypothetical protein